MSYYAPLKAIDNDPKTSYSSNKALDWIQFDLGIEYRVKGMEVWKREKSEHQFVSLEASIECVARTGK